MGLRKVVSFGQSQDLGKLVETLIHLSLSSQNKKEIFYWQGNGEIDFILRDGLTITDLIQVVSSG